MAIIKCKMCGGNLNVVAGETVAECEYCGTRQTVPSMDNEKKMSLFTRASKLRFGCEFDKAAGIYESIVADFPEEAEAYWGLVLCKYGIEYVDDPASGRKVPTCHRSSFDSVMDDSNLEMACENADAMARRLYREEAKQIEEIRKGIIEVSGKEAPYDIFICYKETAENGQRTLDSVLAQDVYDALTEKGYRVFFSRITLEDKLGQEYEPYIFAALHSAKVMLVFGTDYEYFNAVWVKNEWSRYLQLMTQDKTKHLIPCYKGLDAYDMPKEFNKLQAQDMGKVGAIQDLLRGIDKLVRPESKIAAAPPTAKTLFGKEDAKQFAQSNVVIIPEGITVLSGEAFRGNKVLEHITLPSTLQSIGDKCFYECSALKAVELPEGLIGIGARAFWDCTSLEQINIPKSVKAIGERCFRSVAVRHFDVSPQNEYYCQEDGVLLTKKKEKLLYYPPAKADTEYQVPDAVRRIESGAFYECKKLRRITLHNGLESIGGYAFDECERLETMEIPAQLTEIASTAFILCGSLRSIRVEPGNRRYIVRDNALIDTQEGKLIIYCAASGASSYRADSFIRTICENAFSLARNLREVVLDGVTEIQDYAFSQCEGLEKLTLPNTLQTIGDHAFRKCPRLRQIIANGSYFTAVNNVLYSGDKTRLVAYPASRPGSTYLLEQETRVIGTSAFDTAQNLTDVYCREGLTEIQDRAFYSGVMLSRIIIPVANVTMPSRLVLNSQKKQLTVFCQPGSQVEAECLKKKVTVSPIQPLHAGMRIGKAVVYESMSNNELRLTYPMMKHNKFKAGKFCYVYVTAMLTNRRNLPFAVIKLRVFHNGANIGITENTIDLSGVALNSDANVCFGWGYYQNPNGWQKGNYVFEVSADGVPPIEIPFRVV